MADLPDDLLEEVGEARVAGGGNYFNHGDYLTMIDKWFYQKIQDRCIILETIVIEARKKVVYEGQKKVEDEPNEVSSRANATANFDGKGKQSAASNSRAPVLGLYGFKEGKVRDEDVKKALSKALGDNQPMRGMLVALSTYPKEVRSNKGNYITGLAWSKVATPGTGINAPELAKARADAFDKGGGEECVKVTRAQIKQLGAAIGLPSADGDGKIAEDDGKAAAAAEPTSAEASPDLPEDELPNLPEEKPADPLAGWKQHPKNPEYYYKGKELKKKADLLAGR